MTPDAVVELSEDECRKLLATAVIGRFVFTIGALPAVVPLAFAVDDGAAVCRTSASSRLAGAADGGVISVQADQIEPTTRSGWSVVGTGVAQVVRDPKQVGRIAALVEPWVSDPDQVTIRLPLTVLTGRRIGGGKDTRPTAPAADASAPIVGAPLTGR